MTSSEAGPGWAAEGATSLWSVARDRVAAYLRVAGVEQEPARHAAAALVDRLAAVNRPASAEAAALLALGEVRRLVTDAPLRSDQGPGSLLPRTMPLQVRRQSLEPVISWRLGRWLPETPPPTRGEPIHHGRPALAWTARLRRAIFMGLGLLTTVWCVVTFTQILAINGLSILDLAHLAVFTILVLWLSQSFWTLTAGFGVRLWRLAAGRPRGRPDGHVDVGGRVALLMPIYNEDTERVFAGLRAMWRDLRREAPEDSRFDLFVLSDTTDPDIWLAEVEAWRRLREEVGDRDRIFYRRRDRNIARKAGNIEDFIARFGGSYAYMLILDADSLMTGACMHELVRRMDENPDVGLIQAPPKLVRGRSLFARILQCAGELYGPLAASGTAFWACGEGNYWGHNAIIRIRPFSQLCGLPQLPGRAPFGGHILSHDFVEAALMRRGGWQVWIADDLGGSYEEPPPTLEDFAVRDRRWCQGNLQHLRVVFARDLHWVSRMHLGIGIMSYLTSPLWLVFLVLAGLQAWEVTHTRPLYFLEGWPLPVLPVSMATEATILLAATLGLLFLPKLMGLLLALLDGRRRRALGGTMRILASAILETLYSALIAPIMMLLHTRFVTSILAGAAIDWTPQRRSSGQSQVMATLRTFFWPTVIGFAVACAVWVYVPILFFWLLPVTAGLVLAAPLALLGASEAMGERLRRRGLLLVSEECQVPAVMRELGPEEGAPDAEPPGLAPHLVRFARVVLEAQANAIHLQLQRAFGTAVAEGDESLRLLERKAVFVGPTVLERAERRRILEDPDLLQRLHLEAWVHWPTFLPDMVAAVGAPVSPPACGCEPEAGRSTPAAA